MQQQSGLLGIDAKYITDSFVLIKSLNGNNAAGYIYMVVDNLKEGFW